jgi:hypothetical protein
MDMLLCAERCSAAILDGILVKMGDPGVPTISCLIGTQKFVQALCDLRASMSIMPKVIYDQLNHDSLVPTSMYLQLADQLIWCPVGIVEDIPMRIRNSFVPVDFVVFKMDVCHQTPLILGMPFLSTLEPQLMLQLGSSSSTLLGRRRHSHSNPAILNSATKSWSRSDQSGMLSHLIRSPAQSRILLPNFLDASRMPRLL